MFQNTQKNSWKTLESLETYLKLTKTLWQIKNMVKLVRQHKQIDHVKSNNIKELHYFFNKIPKSSSQKHENMKSGLPDICWWCRTVWYMIFVIASKITIKYQNNTHKLQSWFDSILIVFYNIMVFSVIFDSSLILENVLDTHCFSE